jgi:hypothetical protein
MSIFINMSLKERDVIYIQGFKDEEPDFYCDLHFRDLIGFPTRVFTIQNDIIYVTHPILDVVPLFDCVNYEILEDVNLGYHRELKDKLQTLKKMGVPRVPKKSINNFFEPNNLTEQKEIESKNQWLLDLINDLNNNDIDEEFLNNYIGGWERFISIVTKKGLLHLIDPFSPSVSDYQNILLWSFVQNDSSFIWAIVDKYLSDVTKIGDDYYVDIEDAGELAQFYKKDRDIAESTIENILSGEFDFDPFYDVSDNVYRDCYDNLKPEHQLVVKQNIKGELMSMGTIDITYRTPDLFDEIGEEQGNDSEITLNEEVIDRMLEDDDSIEYLINQEMDDIRSELYSLYSSCYTSAWYDEAYDDVWSPLIGEVIDENKPIDYRIKKSVWNRYGNREEKEFSARRYKATKCIYNTVNNWLNYYKGNNGEYSENIEYFGSYLGLLKNLMDYGEADYLRVPSLPDWADSTLVEKCINDSFNDYFG